MRSFFGAVVLVSGVMALLKVFGLFPRALVVVHTSRSALEVMHTPALGDDRKEALLQGYALSLLRSFLDLVIRSAGAIAIPVGLVRALEFAGVMSLEAVVALTLSWPFLLVGVLAPLAAFWLLEK